MEKKRMNHIDLLETVAIFFVLLYHSTLYSYDFLSEYNVAHYLRYFFRTILSTCVPLFFFANGYLLFSRDFNLCKHIIKTIKLILLTVIWGIITLLILQVINQEYFSIIDFIKALWTWKQDWINHLWYMGALVCIYAFFPLLKCVFDANKKIFYYFTIITALFTFGNTLLNHVGVVCMSCLSREPNVVTTINFFNFFNPFRGIHGYTFVYFCVGGVAYYFRDMIMEIPVKKRNVISVLGILLSCVGLFVMGVFFSKTTGKMWEVVWYGYDTIFTFLNVIFIHFLCVNLKSDKQYFKIISSNTIGIYFIHIIIISIMRPYLIQYDFLRNLPFNIVYAIMILMACLIVCFIIKKIPVVSKLLK